MYLGPVPPFFFFFFLALIHRSKTLTEQGDFGGVAVVVGMVAKGRFGPINQTDVGRKKYQKPPKRQPGEKAASQLPLKPLFFFSPSS